MMRPATNPATDIRQRLERGAATLAVIDYRRGKTHDPGLGAGIERWIIDRELNELEGSPPAGCGQQTRVRRRRKGRDVLLVKAKWWLRRTPLKKRVLS